MHARTHTLSIQKGNLSRKGKAKYQAENARVRLQQYSTTWSSTN